MNKINDGMMYYKKTVNNLEKETIVFVKKYKNDEEIAGAFFSCSHYNFSRFKEDIETSSAEDFLRECARVMEGRAINHAARLLDTDGGMTVYYFVKRESADNKHIGKFSCIDDCKKAIIDHQKTARSKEGTYNINIDGFIHNIKSAEELI